MKINKSFLAPFYPFCGIAVAWYCFMPNIELLKDYGDGGIKINQKELEENKNKIVETLNNYKIGISNIKATIGPTVTLYEIVPYAGIRISKIKNLEDDIALSMEKLAKINDFEKTLILQKPWIKNNA